MESARRPEIQDGLGSQDKQEKERATGFEPATPSLGSSYSTAELCPLGARRLKFSQRLSIVRFVVCLFNYVSTLSILQHDFLFAPGEKSG